MKRPMKLPNGKPFPTFWVASHVRNDHTNPRETHIKAYIKAGKGTRKAGEMRAERLGNGARKEQNWIGRDARHAEIRLPRGKGTGDIDHDRMLQSVLGYIDGKITDELTGAGLAICHFTVFTETIGISVRSYIVWRKQQYA
jgi:hypothetical protein